MMPKLSPWLSTIALFTSLQCAAAEPGAPVEYIPSVINIAGGIEDRANGVAVQADGKILLAGTVYGDGRAYLAYARMFPDGTPDPGFADGGQHRVSFGASSNGIGSWIGQMRDGRILVVGTVLDSIAGARSIVLMRLLQNGDPDNTFSIDGIVRVGEDVNAMCGVSLENTGLSTSCEVALLPDGKVVIVGSGVPQDPVRGGLSELGQILVYRILPDGTPDPGFGPDGRRFILTLPNNPASQFGGLTVGMDVRNDGSILLASSVATQDTVNRPGIGLMQLRPNGTLDASFGDGGASVIPAASGDGFLPNAVHIARDGRIYVGAFGALSGVRSFVAARFLPDGTPDPAYGSGGVTGARFDLSGNAESNDAATALHVDGAGRAYVIGYGEMPRFDTEENYDMAVVRFTPEGLPDNSFGPRGGRNYGFDISVGGGPATVFRERAFDVAVDGQGRMVIAGGADGAGDGDLMMVRTIYTHDLFRDTFDDSPVRIITR